MRRLVLLAAALALSVASAQARPGALDPGFGRDGRVATAVGSGDAVAYALAIQPDGKILAAGESDLVHPSFALVRYRRNGRLDRSFGEGGKVTTSFDELHGGALAVALQPDGKIVAAGAAGPDFALVRYDREGSPDASFGAAGTVRTAFPGAASAAVFGVALQPDGKVVAAGTVIRAGTLHFDVALARYLPHGSLDETFGAEGRELVVLPRDSSWALGVAVQPDGKIVVAGSRFETGGFTGDYHGFLLARLLRDGLSDPSFGAGGVVSTRVGAGGLATSVALRPDGRIVAGGSTLGHWTDAGSPRQHFALARYLPDGTLDGSFGAGGIVTTAVASDAAVEDLVLRPDGRILAAGSTASEPVLAAYRPDGSLDRSFGRSGRVRTPLGDGHGEAHAVALQPDGKAVVAGESYDSARERLEFALVRYLDRQKVCRVPRVKHERLVKARRTIRGAHCAVGRVRRVFSKQVRKGRVIAQRPRAGTRLAAGSKVRLVVSKGTRTRR